MPELIERLQAEMRPREREAVESVRRLCEESGASLFLVGGAVRDLVLGRVNIDLDLAMESEVEPVARGLAARMEARLVLHPRFGTATVYGRGFHLDIARTRRETYAHPGALPSVDPASLDDDLARRDFAFNAMALRLTRPRGELVDPFDGAGDIERRLIRVLHQRSFQDDATRMLRAVRYAARLGFALEQRTEGWLRRDLPYLDTVSGSRLRRELALLFEHEGAVDGTLLAEALGVLRGVHPKLRLEREVADRWREALTEAHHGEEDALGFCIVAAPAAAADAASVSDRLHLRGRVERALNDLVRLRRLSAKLAASMHSPAEVVEVLDGQAPAAVQALAVIEGGVVADLCRAYLDDWRRVRPHLTGRDLLALGVAPGAGMGEMLRRLRRARLEGRTSTREDEVALLRSELQPGAGE